MSAPTLGAALAARAEPVLLTPEGEATGAEIAAARPGAALSGALGQGVALSLRAPRALLGLLAALDGRAARVLLLSPALPPAAVAELVAAAGAAALVSDRDDLPEALSPAAALDAPAEAAPRETAWLLTTSGTTGTPKMVAHRLAGLARTVKPAPEGPPPVWGLLYEPTRFAGLQVVLQALLGGGRLAALPADAAISERLGFLARARATHISATPTLWRRVLMDPAAEGLAPGHVTLGGEIADDAVLSALARRFPAARIRHIYASTEAGVGFSVRDGRAGFPAAFLEAPQGGVALKIAEGRLWIRPPGARPEALGGGHAQDAEGYIDTGDRVAREGDRVRFLGRETSAVNIGGAKIQPEEIEYLIHDHPEVAMARIETRPSPITGALLMLTVVPEAPEADAAALKKTLAAFCRERLPREARPARIRIASRAELEAEITAAGKLARTPAAEGR